MTTTNKMEVEIRKVIESSYNPTTIPQLEEYVIACCEGKVVYIYDAIRTLIKLYQLFPITNTSVAGQGGSASNDNTDNNTTDGSTSSANTLVTTLKSKRHVFIGYSCFLALLEYPNSSDLLSLTYMIPQTITLKESCPYVFKCNDSLRLCNFNDFWKHYESLKSSSDSIVSQIANNSIIKLQCSIMYVLSLSYKRAPISIVTSACNTTKLEPIATASKKLSESSSSVYLDVIDNITTEFVVFKPTTDNTKRQRVYQEGVSFASISSLLHKMGQ
jgi:hypothetical protein